MDKHSAIEAAAAAMEEDNERVAGNRARIAANQRCEARFSAFLNRASDADERESRLSLIEGAVHTLVADVCNEHQYDNPAKMASEVLETLKVACFCKGCGEIGCSCKGGDDCSCGGEDLDVTKGSDESDDSDDSGDEKEASTKLACGCDGNCGDDCSCEDGECSCGTKEASTQKEAEFETGYQSETQTLDTASDTEGTTTGLGGPVPEMDETAVGDASGGDNLYGLPKIEDPASTRHQKVDMEPGQKEPEFTSDARETGASHPDVSETINADETPGEEIVGPSTETFGDKSNTADPVTSKTVESKWGIHEERQD